MGTVYRAFDLKLGRDVALKVVSAEDETSELFLRFVQEGAAAARIRHPNVVQVFNAGSEGGYAYLAMQLLSGETLAECLTRRGRLPLTLAVDFTLPICSALMTAHDAGVLHRDLKPANIFLADVGRGAPEPYLLDFGISKLDGPVDAALTQNPRFLGTPFYIAPEQADGAAGSWLSDQYSLALCLYECLLGVRPFEQHKSSLVKLLRHVAEGAIVPARDIDVSIPMGLDAILSRALATDPRDRYESMRDFGAALLPFASPTQRHIWQAAFVTANDETMTSASTPVIEPGTPLPDRSGEVTVQVLGPPRQTKRMTDTLSQSPDFDAVRSSLSRRDLPLGSAGADPTNQRMDNKASERPRAASPSLPPSSSRRFNSVGVERPIPREPKRSPLAIAALSAIGVCSLWMSAWLINEELTRTAIPTYTAEVAVTPIDAEITLDGTTLSRGSLSLVLPKDGERHELLITHPNYEPSKILFQDRPPAPKITLRPLDLPPESMAEHLLSKEDRTFEDNSQGQQPDEVRTILAASPARAATSPPQTRAPSSPGASDRATPDDQIVVEGSSASDAAVSNPGATNPGASKSESSSDVLAGGTVAPASAADTKNGTAPSSNPASPSLIRTGNLDPWAK